MDSVLDTHGKEAPGVRQKVRNGVLTCIAEAGFIPAQRDAHYNVLTRFETEEVSAALARLAPERGEWMKGGFSYAQAGE